MSLNWGTRVKVKTQSIAISLPFLPLYYSEVSRQVIRALQVSPFSSYKGQATHPHRSSHSPELALGPSLTVPDFRCGILVLTSLVSKINFLFISKIPF